MRLRTLFILICAAIAGVAFAAGPLNWIVFAAGNDIPTAKAISLSIWLGCAWIVSFLVALRFAGRRGLWLLLAAPFALYWPGMWIFVGHACYSLGTCASLMGLIFSPEYDE